MNDPVDLDQLLTVIRAHGYAPVHLELPSGLKLDLVLKPEAMSPGEEKLRGQENEAATRSSRVMRDLGIKDLG